MFLPFFYKLRSQGIPAGTGEFLDFLKVIDTKTKRDAFLPLDDLYRVGRLCLVKDIKHYDSYDIVFSECFGNLQFTSEKTRKLVEDWLEKAKKFYLSEERKRNAPLYDIDRLLEELQDRLKRQKGRHDGGDTWVGTGGTSPFGHGGFNPQGIRIGGEAGNRTGVAVWADRKFRPYRTDEVLDVRKIQLALKYLRILKKEGRPEIHIPKTIQKTSDNGGDIEIIEEKSRKNNLKVVLLMDIGGSMTPHSQKVSALFTAAHRIQHFKEFYTFYFHNIFNKEVYEDPYLRKPYSLKRFFQKFRPDTRIIYVGDAWMAPYELLAPAINPYAYRSFSSIDDLKGEDRRLIGIDALREMKEKFPNSVWLNPEPKRLWWETTIEAIGDVVPMYFLSVDGIQSAVKDLVGNH
ncbi:MAG: VWA domain-containing protein [Leptospira sp.]|nr:VWA domain-containing protein [Leptospira sp.]